MKKTFYSCIFFILAILLLFWEWNTNLKEKLRPLTSYSLTLNSKRSSATQVNSPAKEFCNQYRVRYADISKLKKTKDLQLRFENTHIQINNKIYRLRQFSTDSPEGARKTFLAYIEDEEEYPHIIEKKLYSPGPIFQSLLHEKNSVIYHEEAYLFANSNFFLHFINNRLTAIQNNFLECIFKSDPNDSF